MSYKLVASLLSHKDATPEMAERIFLHGVKENQPNKRGGYEDGSAEHIANIAAASRVFNKQLFDKYKHDPRMLDLMYESKHFKRFVDDHIKQHGIGKTLEHSSHYVYRAATKTPEFKELLKQLGIHNALFSLNPRMQWATAKTPEFKEWLKQPDNMDKALKHPDPDIIIDRIINTPEFKDYVSNHIKQHGMEKTLEHPNWYVSNAAIKTPEFKDYVSNHIKQHGMEKTLEHPNWHVQRAADAIKTLRIRRQQQRLERLERQRQ
jgi:hypothetical protein